MSDGAVDAILHAVPSSDDRHKPRLAFVNRWRRKGITAEGAWPILPPEDSACHLIAR